MGHKKASAAAATAAEEATTAVAEGIAEVPAAKTNKHPMVSDNRLCHEGFNRKDLCRFCLAS